MNLTLLIDLDDTLLPHSTEKFLPIYLKALSEHLSELAPPEKVQELLLMATYEAMNNDDPSITIKQAFDENFYPKLGTTHHQMLDSLEDFYTNIHPSLAPIPSPKSEIVDIVDKCLEKGYHIAIATNPIFPKNATYQRLRWAGLAPEDYPHTLISTYENFHFSKPAPAYYMEFMAQLGWPDSQVVMVGDDQTMDILPAQQLGLPTYWVTNDYTKRTCGNRHGIGPIEDLHSWLEIQSEDDLKPDLTSFLSSLEIIRTTPAALQSFLYSLPPDQWNNKPDEINWSITEILCHWRDVDLEVHIPRFEMLRDNPAPFLTAIDADSWAEERNYHQQDGQQALADFVNARKRLVDLASNLPSAVEKKVIRHTIFGPTSLNEIMRIAARHDRLHIQQMFSLIQPT